MIKTKKDLKQYLEQDRKALGIKGGVKDWLTHDIWQYQRALRRMEYAKNNASNALGKIVYMLWQLRVRKLGRKLGFSIPANVFGPGLAIAHAGTIVVNNHARVGKNCRLHVCVNIGADVSNGELAPQIGDDCYIAPGAKIFGNITIGNNVGIGANAVVNKSFASHVTIAGSPAKVISQRGPAQFRSQAVLKGCA